jgi:hypothetical protein
MREWLMGWTAVYWPAYLATFAFTGWSDHWAEMQGRHAAGVVDRALSGWRPKQRATTTSRRSARAGKRPGKRPDKRPDKQVTVGAWAAIVPPGR